MVPNIFWKYTNKLGIGGNQASLAILLLNLISRGYNFKDHCNPGHKTIADDMGVKVNTVERGLRKLRDLELIEIEAQFDGKTFKSNIYTWSGFRGKLRKLLIEDGLISG